MQIRLSSKVIEVFKKISNLSVFCLFSVEDFKNTSILFKRFLIRYLNLTIYSTLKNDVIYVYIEIDNP